MRIIVTGGCGFIGSAAVRAFVKAGHQVLNIDKLTYAGDTRTVGILADSPNYYFKKLDIRDQTNVAQLLVDFSPETVFHLAAETHVDRSIDNPNAFVDTNFGGSFAMLQASLRFWKQLDSDRRARFRFIQVSTDEVYGSLDDGLFSENSRYRPSSPYSATKAGADHLANAWYATYGLPTIVSNCSNNYGPFQNREKLVPTIIRKALMGQPIPIYGCGRNVRDWLYVDDHVDALLAICDQGRIGSSYNIAARNEITNIELATKICLLLDERRPRSDGHSHAESIQFVADRPGHDYRYAIDSAKAEQELGWKPRYSLQSGLSKTVDWYLDNLDWTVHSVGQDDRLGLASPPRPSPLE